MPAPAIFEWTGDSFVPLARFQRQCDRDYVIGERYRLVEQQERSDATHRHEFAWLREAWLNLPEEIADGYPSPEHLRKAALIEAGWFDETIVDAGSNAAALRVASFVRSLDEFAVVIVRGPLVIRRTAKSQSRRAMDRKDFAASKQAIMEVVAGLLGVATADLQRAEAA